MTNYRALPEGTRSATPPHGNCRGETMAKNAIRSVRRSHLGHHASLAGVYELQAPRCRQVYGMLHGVAGSGAPPAAGRKSSRPPWTLSCSSARRPAIWAAAAQAAGLTTRGQAVYIQLFEDPERAGHRLFLLHRRQRPSMDTIGKLADLRHPIGSEISFMGVPSDHNNDPDGH